MKLIPSNKVVTGGYPILFLVTLLAPVLVSSNLSACDTLKCHISAADVQKANSVMKTRQEPISSRLGANYPGIFGLLAKCCQCWIFFV